MDANAKLTAGSVQKCRNEESEGMQPVVQVVKMKKIPAKKEGGKDKVRLILSDGVNITDGMMSGEAVDEKLKALSVIVLKEFTNLEIGGRKLIMVTSFEWLRDEEAKIGNPVKCGAPKKEETKMDVEPDTPVKASVKEEVVETPVKAMESLKVKQSAKKTPKRTPGGGPKYQPICTLNPYNGSWTIKVRVTAKQPMRTWSNQRGDGRAFSVDLLDDQAGEIRATMFNEAADKLYSVFEEGKVFQVSRGRLKIANKQFSRLSNDYEIVLNENAKVVPVDDDDSIKTQTYKFVKISDIAKVDNAKFIDVLGVVTSVGELASVMSKAKNREMQKRVIKVCDESMAEIECTIWGEKAVEHEEGSLLERVVAIKGARVSDWNQKSLSTTMGGSFEVEPALPEVATLKAWREGEGKSATLSQLSENTRGGGGNRESERMPMQQIVDDNLGFKEKADWAKVRARIVILKHSPERPPWYTACPKCNKKVSEAASGWACDSCGWSGENAQKRYILSVLAADSSGGQWLSAFNDTALKLVGRPANEVAEALEAKDEAQYNAYFKKANFQEFVFNVKALARPNQQGEQMLRCIISSMQKPNVIEECKHMLTEIAKYGGGKKESVKSVKKEGDSGIKEEVMERCE